MSFQEDIKAFSPIDEKEAADQKAMLSFIERNPDNVLLRSNEIAHMTSSSMIFNKAMNKVLMAYHNIYQSWCWTGGHADGDPDLLAVAVREAQEETSVSPIRILSPNIVALDIITVPRHIKRGAFVPAHVHLNTTYALMADESSAICSKPDENSGVAWIPIEDLKTCTAAEPFMFEIYDKIIKRSLSLPLSSPVHMD